MNVQPGAARKYCNILALARGLDPAGHAGSFRNALVLETPLPWRPSVYQAAGALPQQMIDLLALWLERYNAGEPYDHYIMMVAPDPEYSRPGYRRVLYYMRPEGQFARFTRHEYMAPDAEVGDLIWALHEDPAQLPAFAHCQVEAAVPDGSPMRDILVCTHGTVDAACARFGYPLYRRLRDTCSSENVRIWRVSHFGGHVFAPTLIDMPGGHYWAYVGETEARQIIARDGDVAALRSHFRGWGGLESGFEQAADSAIWQREGWGWFGTPRQSTRVASDTADDPQRAKVRITYTRGDGEEGSYTALVNVTHQVQTVVSTGDSEEYSYPQYAVAELLDEPCPPPRTAHALPANQCPLPSEEEHG